MKKKLKILNTRSKIKKCSRNIGHYEHYINRLKGILFGYKNLSGRG